MLPASVNAVVGVHMPVKMYKHDITYEMMQNMELCKEPPHTHHTVYVIVCCWFCCYTTDNAETCPSSQACARPLGVCECHLERLSFSVQEMNVDDGFFCSSPNPNPIRPTTPCMQDSSLQHGNWIWDRRLQECPTFSPLPLAFLQHLSLLSSLSFLVLESTLYVMSRT